VFWYMYWSERIRRGEALLVDFDSFSALSHLFSISELLSTASRLNSQLMLVMN
jgi:hypothetical protein